jgi:lipopolysaccharide biosynthesis glycosyltransferase
MYDFCTISTADHLFKVLALRDSLVAQNSDAFIHVLCIDPLPANLPYGNIAFYTTADISNYPVARTILSKYQSSQDKIRWSLKPIFIKYLLENKANKVIYCDNDIYFYDSYAFLFDLLDQNIFLLTPHHYPRDPNKDQNWLEANFRVGLYNAGFIAATNTAVETLQWWAECCAYRCEKNSLRGLFDDQKYLDLVPVINENVHIVRHAGCNVAEWNKAIIHRSNVNGKVMLNNSYPLIFIHFNGTTVRAIKNGEEPFLKSSLDRYLDVLKKYKPDLNINTLYKPVSFLEKLKLTIWQIATKAGV